MTWAMSRWLLLRLYGFFKFLSLEHDFMHARRFAQAGRRLRARNAMHHLRIIMGRWRHWAKIPRAASYYMLVLQRLTLPVADDQQRCTSRSGTRIFLKL